MYLAVKFYYNMLREIKTQGRYAMLGTFSRFDTPYFLLRAFRCRHPEGVTEIENKKWLERDSEAFKQLRVVANYDRFGVAFSISGLSSSTLGGLDLGSNPSIDNTFLHLLLIYMYFWFLDCF